MKLEASDRSLISETPYLMVKVPGGRMRAHGGLDQDGWSLELLVKECFFFMICPMR